ncbi:Na/Pi cotransporter family protein [Tunicatimonas pelagia]|uniref:Na/Pi cotransporter family protein n=1 Tax=Tunicatimonas pelagia TaxID=931531 RepID=UPI0026650DF9|nr:Na/Pi symporter [Tunicatimonas pelagia]WKN43906.1 Na/Pi symporter [Tunicatimonas pelagia]
MTSADTSLDWLSMVMGLIAGLVLFIFAVTQLSDAVKTIANDKIRIWLARFTTNRFSGVLTGTAATAVVGSSSVTIIMVIALVNAGLLTFVESLGVVMGSNIGTTLSSQLIAFDVDEYAPIGLLVGLLLQSLGRSARWRSIGRIVFTLGLIFFALGLMGEAMNPLKDYPPFLETLKDLENPWLGVLVGAVATVLIQSSSATMGIVITLASQGMMTLPAGVAVMLGAEIGTCADTLIATIGRDRAAIRTGIFHLAFNMATVIGGVLMVDGIIQAAEWMSDGASLERKVANAHLIFNVGGVVVFIGLAGTAAKVLQWLVPDKRKKLTSV